MSVGVQDRVPEVVDRTGPLAWMVKNRATASLIMFVLILGGIFMLTRITQEMFPDFDLDIVNVVVPYPGASPEEVEHGIILAIEEAIRGIDGIKQIDARASEGSGAVTVELLDGADPQRVYQDIKQLIDRITTFPEEAEEPRVSIAVRRRDVLSIVVYGDTDDWVLRDVAEFVRDQLLQNPGITQVDLGGVRDYEIRVDVPQRNLRSYNLTFEQIANAIRQSVIEIPGGSIRSAGGEILLRVRDRRNWAREFGDIPIVTTSSGTIVRLRDIADVSEGFEDSDRMASFEGLNAVGVQVFRVGTQTPISVSKATREVLREIEHDLPPGVRLDIMTDRSEYYFQRLELLLRNGFFGLVIVLASLGIFLHPRVALWVTMCIPTSFLGAILFLPAFSVSINMISMFAFITALGLVVDSAIVASENIHNYQQSGAKPIDAAIHGIREVALPIAFSMITNVIAFIPLLYVPGHMGKIWAVVPIVVISASLIAWLVPMFIIPAQLAHTRKKKSNSRSGPIQRWQNYMSDSLAKFVSNIYDPFLDACIRRRYLTLSLCVAVLVLVVSYAFSGRMGIVLMATVESNSAYATARLPYGSPVERSMAVRDRLVATAEELRAEYGGDELVEGIYATINANIVEVGIHLTQPDVRPISTGAVTNIWREKLGPIPGVESIRFESDRGGPGRGSSITVELSHRDIGVLSAASADLAASLELFANTTDVDDGYTPGKEQLSFRLKPEGLSLGLSARDVARQVRNAFHGSEALRQQRGRNEVTVRVRLPVEERLSEYDIERLLIRTPSGTDVPLYQIAEVERGRAYTVITRRDGRRTVSVTANVVPDTETNRVIATLNERVLPQLVADHPGLAHSYRGRQVDMADSVRSLYGGLILALLAIFALLVIPFRSYAQPLVVMMAIPFGVVGAILGHLIMGYAISLISLLGIVALTGVVVNNALVMIDYANRRRLSGDSALAAIHRAGLRRFRPILLTTITTFGGLAPMIFETSRQARFMIPMAISLGYGVVFATLVTLILVPCLYMIIEDAVGLVRNVTTEEDDEKTGAGTPATERVPV